MKIKFLGIAAIAAAAALLLSGCAQGEGSALAAKPAATKAASGTWSSDVLNIDFATYNPLSLVIKDQGWIEKTLGPKV
ncbi:MAG: sulfonate transport system substrate-binding protein, partial [Microbacteriaceae bacterium]|nr:sulfonate transport system substrate-binding protein [Microbacteriaceae bacterium]